MLKNLITRGQEFASGIHETAEGLLDKYPRQAEILGAGIMLAGTMLASAGGVDIQEANTQIHQQAQHAGLPEVTRWVKDGLASPHLITMVKDATDASQALLRSGIRELVTGGLSFLAGALLVNGIGPTMSVTVNGEDRGIVRLNGLT